LRPLLRTGLLCASMLIGAAATAPAHAAATVTVPDNIAPWVAKATKLGTAGPNTKVTIAIYMAVHDLPTLKAFVADVSRPTSASYGKYLTPAAFRARFAPAAADVTAVRDLLTSAGMTKITTGPGGFVVTARATVAQINAAFGISEKLYSYKGLTMMANDEAPSIPAALSGKVLSIGGLNEGGLLRHPMHHTVFPQRRAAPAGLEAATATAAAAGPAITPPPVADNQQPEYCDTYYGDLEATLSTSITPFKKTLPWTICGYTPQQIRAAYGMDKVTYDGTGIKVAIVDAYASPTLRADGDAYAANHGLPKLTTSRFQEIIPGGIYGVSPSAACDPYGWWGEESLDLAAVHGSAPGADIVYIGSEDCNESLTVALVDAIYNDTADIITNSYSYGGDSDTLSDIEAQNDAFMAAASTGITVMFSSGDDGDLSQDNGVATGSFEADSPYVTGVGGTSLAIKNKAGAKDEWGWGNYVDALENFTINSGTSITTTGVATVKADGQKYDNYQFYAGSGGGITLLAAEPDYQVPVVPSALATTLNEASGYSVPIGPNRVSPDVAMDADPFTGYLYGESYTIAGNAIADANCTPTGTTTEYCEGDIGGTSLASPLFAGTIAIVDQARVAAGKPKIGFANPWLYGGTIGTTLTSSGINDVQPPTAPEAVLLAFSAYDGYAAEAAVVTLNSVPFDIQADPFPLELCGTASCLGIDDIFNYTTAGYDDVTGLGVPYLPMLVTQ